MLKDSKSLETCCYVIGAGAFGIFFRWMQLQLAFDDGLPGKSVWHFFVLLLIAASAAVFWYFIRKFEKAYGVFEAKVAVCLVALRENNGCRSQRRRCLADHARARMPPAKMGKKYN